MTRRTRPWLWLLIAALIVAGWLRLRFDVEVLNLLPDKSPVVHGLKIWQQHFANASELIVTVRAPDAERAETAARAIAGRLRDATNLVSRVTWQPPWIEHPAQIAELLAYLWLNQPPDLFANLTNRLASDRIGQTLAAAREQLATSMSPSDIARLSYDPFGLTQLPAGTADAAPSFTGGQELFASADGTFRILFVQSAGSLSTYRECARWLSAVKEVVRTADTGSNGAPGVAVNFTGSPAFVAEISSSMEHDMTFSVAGTALIIALLFWLAHRRWKPMLWLLTLLALILAGTLAVGGLLFGTINVVSMGFAAILLGLAVDYAVVHYQEALAHPDLSVPEVRRAIAPSIFWAAFTTIAAFLVLNFGGLPGLGQLGSLVGLGVALSAVVMIFAFLPPLFPERRRARPVTHDARVPKVESAHGTSSPDAGGRPGSARRLLVFTGTIALILFSAGMLLFGFPRMDATADALRPRGSPSYAALEAIKQELGNKREPLWLLVGGRDERDVARRLDVVQDALTDAVSNHVVSDFVLPAAVWPRPHFQEANRRAAAQLSDRVEPMRSAALASGFSSNSLALTEGVFVAWRHAASVTNVFWPANELSRWIFEKFAARTPTNLYALGLIYRPDSASPATGQSLAPLTSKLPANEVWLSGWELLGDAVFSSVRSNLWKLMLPVSGLVLLSLWFAFRRPVEVLLSVGILLLSGLCLLALMRVFGWSWNLLNLMALPLIMGTGVDYSIFMQLGLRRHRGDLRIAHRSVGRALLLCGGTAVSGFGALAFSSNAGMAGLGKVCAAGIACNMLISVLLLPVWWSVLADRSANSGLATPSFLYRAGFWRFGLRIVRVLPRKVSIFLGHSLASCYWLLARQRREITIQNLLPALRNDRSAATRKARALLHRFVVKVIDLWQYEAGLPISHLFGEATGLQHFEDARAAKRGVLLLTVHLGNWEFGGPWLAQRGVALQVVTMLEPGKDFTQLRQASRARWNIETLVIGHNPFASVEIIRRLESGAVVALLVDRPPVATAVTVELFGRPFTASVAAAELARASGCVLLPVYLPRAGDAYAAHILPPIQYDRVTLRDRAARQELTQKIMRAFEPAILQHLDQWYHFVPIWPK